MAETAKFRRSALDEALSELERNLPGIRGLPGRAFEVATTVPRAAAAVGMRAVQDRTLPVVAGADMLAEGLAPTVGASMRQGQTTMGFPPEAVAETRRVQQAINPQVHGVLSGTVAPRVAAAVPAVAAGLAGAAPAVAAGLRGQTSPPASLPDAQPAGITGTEPPQDMISRIEAAGVRNLAGRDASGRLAFEGPRIVSVGGRTVLTNLADASGQLSPGLARAEFSGPVVEPQAMAPASGVRNSMQPVQAGELLRNISAENLTPAGISAAASLQAASERGIRQRVRDTQAMIEEERRMAEAETAAENAAINRENMLINRQRANLDLAKGIRELEQGPEVKLETVELGDVAGTKQTYVRTPQGQLVPFAQYQMSQAVDPADLAAARGAIAQGRDRAAVLARLQAAYPGVDFSAL